MTGSADAKVADQLHLPMPVLIRQKISPGQIMRVARLIDAPQARSREDSGIGSCGWSGTGCCCEGRDSASDSPAWKRNARDARAGSVHDLRSTMALTQRKRLALANAEEEMIRLPQPTKCQPREADLKAVVRVKVGW